MFPNVMRPSCYNIHHPIFSTKAYPLAIKLNFDIFKCFPKLQFKWNAFRNSLPLIPVFKHSSCSKTVAATRTLYSLNSEEVAGGIESEKQRHLVDVRRKKKVAMWVGYAGTKYHGLQLQRIAEAKFTTVEAELEKAIFYSGGMLASNYGDLNKVGWTRSSRTDKGVHSVATVISLNLEIQESAWQDNDSDGFSIAAAINVHLPPDIRVFSVVPVSRSFSARKFCKQRTYHYFLPANVLKNCPRESSSGTDDKALTMFRRILQEFEGRHPFHNFTVRRLYRPSNSKGKQSWGKISRGRQGQHRDQAANTAEVKHEQLKQFMSDVEVASALRKPDEEMHIKFNHDSLGPCQVPPQLSHDENARWESNALLPMKVARESKVAWWEYEPPEADRIGASHYRSVQSFTCGPIEHWANIDYVRVSVTGDSFMLHQIRKMVGTAVAVFRGNLSIDLMRASLSRHARVVLPIAPPEGLILYSSEFHPPRLPGSSSKVAMVKSTTHSTGVSNQADGSLNMRSAKHEHVSAQPAIHLSLNARTISQGFLEQVILPNILPGLKDDMDPWAKWLQSLDKEGGLVPFEEGAEVVQAWLERIETIKDGSQRY